jgi:hypothetical protein
MDELRPGAQVYFLWGRGKRAARGYGVIVEPNSSIPEDSVEIFILRSPELQGRVRVKRKECVLPRDVKP